MKKILLLVFAVVVAFSTRATHIVGGEFEMLYKGTNLITGDHLYNISLILYFDAKNGSPNAKDRNINIRIFRKRDNAIINNNIQLDSVPSTLVEYYQPECSSGLAIKTYRMYYTYKVNGVQAVYALSPDKYADPQGYYLAWERCCRNYTITNIYSENPDVGGIYAGQTFYLEFPPLKKNGVPFINSSPTLFPPLSDYACPGSLYYVDFAGTDPDGDSLVYSLVTPLNTESKDALPPPIPPQSISLPRPGPYPLVEWRSPFNLNNIIGGNPDLKISVDGLLTVVPKYQGLYVFSVRCEEFRDKVKIGEVRRDFQLLVLAECERAEDPVVEAKPKGSPDGNYVKGNLNVTYSNAVTDDNRCVDIRVTDPDSQNPDDGNSEDVKIKAIPIGFKDNVSDILPDITSAKIVNGGAVEFSVCFPECPFINGPYQIGIIASDNACPLPRLDTVIVTVNVQPPANEKGIFNEHLVDQTVLEGGSGYSHDIIGTDAENEKLELTMVPPDFDFEQYGFHFQETQNLDGRVEGEVTWDTRCDVIDFSKQQNFEFKFLLNDLDECDLLPPDTMVFDLDVDLIDVHPPEIEYETEPGKDTIYLTNKIFETINFNVLGLDQDGDLLSLTGNGIDFNPAQYGATLPPKTGHPVLKSAFSWPLTCGQINLDLKDEFDYQFIVVDDQNRCNYYLADTLHVMVQVLPPDNTKPEIKVNGFTDEQTFSFTVGDPVTLNVSGADSDTSPSDLLALQLIDADGNVLPQHYSFESTPARGNVTGIFSWTTDCSIFSGQHYEKEPFENNYTFSFSVTDDRCHSIKGDTTTVHIHIHDSEQEFTDFIPPNFITPNNDGLNDFFAMVKEDPTTKELVNILPRDNCNGRFVSIRIYNRWGREVFSSTDRDFKWYAENIAVGVYFYSLNYSNREYKGSVTVRL